MHISFSKYHGLGNDFIIVDARELSVDFFVSRASALCDRNCGIGADGILLWMGSVDAPEMTVVNSDGSIAEMCGNGLRCFAKFLGDRFLCESHEIKIKTGAGILSCALERDEKNLVQSVSVGMRAPLEIKNLQVVLVDDVTVDATYINIGNPHVVTFDIFSREDQLRIGPKITACEQFSGGVNTEFVRVENHMLNVAVYERGCGWTRACGTGAVASAIAAVERGFMSHDEEISVRLPGGELVIIVHHDKTTTMKGPATYVYEGTITIV